MRVRLLILAILCATAVGQTQKTLTLPDAIKAVTPWVVQITYEMDKLPGATQKALNKPFLIGPAGTGFVVNDEGYVVTARHVLRYFDQYRDGIRVNGHPYPTGRNRLLLGVAMPNTETQEIELRAVFTLIAFTVVDEDVVHDLALLKPERRFTTARATFLVGRPEEGKRVAVSGYPVQQEILITTSGAIASSWGFKTLREQLPDGIIVPKIEDTFLVDMHVNHGNSGGPVYSVDSASVIGVADAYALEDNVMASDGGTTIPAHDSDGRALMTNAGLGIVVPARFVTALLRKNHLKWTEQR